MPGHQDYDPEQDDLFVTEAATLIGGFQRAGVLSEDDATALLAEHCGLAGDLAETLHLPEGLADARFRAEVRDLLVESATARRADARRGWAFLAAAFAAGVLVGWRWTR